MPKSQSRRTRGKQPPEPRGLSAAQTASGARPAFLTGLAEAVSDDGGVVLGTYREPLGGHWQLLAALPLDRVSPTPYQRDLSETHVAHLALAMDRLGRYVDPIVAVRTPDGRYWTPNGGHRLAAMQALGARSIIAIVVPEPEVAHRILLLNTEKAHNIRERALEVIRLAEALQALGDRPEREYATEFEEPALLTLGLCYQERGRFAGGVYHPVLKRTERFSAAKLSTALSRRRERATALLELDAAVMEVVSTLKERGFQSPYLKAFVVARINPLRFQRGAKADPDEVIGKMLAAARRFDPARVKPNQVAAAGGPAE